MREMRPWFVRDPLVSWRDTIPLVPSVLASLALHEWMEQTKIKDCALIKYLPADPKALSKASVKVGVKP